MIIRRSPLADYHVHSTFSDGAGTIAENIAAAELRGLRALGCVDHVRVSSAWLPDFVAAVALAQETTAVVLVPSIEAKILDAAGTLDMPADISGIQRVLAADHQFPTAAGPVSPKVMGASIAAGEVTARQAITQLADATIAAMERHPGVHVAHLFSILPKMGLSEDQVPDDTLQAMAAAAVRTDAILEISERWRCPGVRVGRVFERAGAIIVLSTDSHAPTTIGVYDYATATLAEIERA